MDSVRAGNEYMRDFVNQLLQDPSVSEDWYAELCANLGSLYDPAVGILSFVDDTGAEDEIPF